MLKISIPTICNLYNPKIKGGKKVKVLLGSDKDGLILKNTIKAFIIKLGYDVIDKTEKGAPDFTTSTLAVTNGLKKGEGELGILFDAYGAGSFISANKVKGIIAAEISDEHSAKMTRDHNNTSIISIGAEIVGPSLTKTCVKEFLQSKYSGGRHQIRVDMLNKMM